MYRKSTFSTITRPKSSERIYINESESAMNSQLFVHDDDKTHSRRIDITMPYLILRERLDTENKLFLYDEYSENNHLHIPVSGESIVDIFSTLHSHNFYEATFVLSGTYTLRIEDEYIDYHPGDCCICNKNINHVGCFDKDFDIVVISMKEEYARQLVEQNTLYNQSCEEEVFPSVMDFVTKSSIDNPFYDTKVFSTFKNNIPGTDNPSFKCMEAILSEITQTHAGKSLFMKGLFCNLFDLFLREEYYHETILHARLSKEEEIVQQVASAYTTKKGIFTRNEIEAITGYSGDYVERIIKKHTGKTLIEFGHGYLLENASLLLKSSSMKIGEICSSLGYTNRYYFNKLFFDRYGISPSEYRKRRATG